MLEIFVTPTAPSPTSRAWTNSATSRSERFFILTSRGMAPFYTFAEGKESWCEDRWWCRLSCHPEQALVAERGIGGLFVKPASAGRSGARKAHILMFRLPQLPTTNMRTYGTKDLLDQLHRAWLGG